MSPVRGSASIERGERPIGAAVDDEDDFEPVVERAVHVDQRFEEIRNHLLVAVDGNYERVAGCHRLHAAATRRSRRR